ncbi:MAG TPA: hypothetical protein VMB47_08085 [Candidatus Aquilonibacter sp.]|nr:hypothetical protein [Candidatus Aquilonibacter sp.]
MDTRSSAAQPRARYDLPSLSLVLAAAVVLFAMLAGCASPGEPVERKPALPVAISDLAAGQSGNDVVLTCSVPKETVDHSTLGEPPSFEVYRAIHPVPPVTSSAPAAAPQLALLVTIPAALVPSYITGNHFRYVDSLTAGDFLSSHQQSVASYMVRTSVSDDKESADSNRVNLDIYPAPLPITDLHAEGVRSAIVLHWTAPGTDLTGDVPAIGGYHVFRANAPTPPTVTATNALNTPTAGVEPNQSAAAAAGASASSTSETPQLTSPLVEIGDADTTEYRDTDVQKDKTYVYSVRSTIQADGKPLESADSNLATVTLRDVYPPSAPTQLLATPVPSEGSAPAHVDLSWGINPETDLAGYNVYRSEEASVPGTRINERLLPTPAFSDMNGVPGRSYYYTVTAVDRTGNESGPSAAVEARFPLAAGSSAGNQVSP